MVQGQVMRVVRGHFRPEFLNRLDEIILFRRLQRADMASIVQIQLEHLRKLLADRKIGLELDRGALDWLASEGYDSTYGARPLKRVIQRNLQNPLAGMILEGIDQGRRHGARVGRPGRTADQRRTGGSGIIGGGCGQIGRIPSGRWSSWAVVHGPHDRAKPGMPPAHFRLGRA